MSECSPIRPGALPDVPVDVLAFPSSGDVQLIAVLAWLPAGPVAAIGTDPVPCLCAQLVDRGYSTARLVFTECGSLHVPTLDTVGSLASREFTECEGVPMYADENAENRPVIH